MKNILLVAFMLTALTGYANKLISIVPSKNVTTLKYSNVKIGQQLSIKDIEEVVIYTENIKENGDYTQYFDLTSLDSGDYTFELNKDCQIIIKSFTVANGKVNFSNEKETIFFKPSSTMKEDKLKISQLTSGTSTLEIEIFYNNDLIHTDALSGSKILNQIYQLSIEKKGDYTIIMKSDNRTFYKNFTI